MCGDKLKNIKNNKPSVKTYKIKVLAFLCCMLSLIFCTSGCSLVVDILNEISSSIKNSIYDESVPPTTEPFPSVPIINSERKLYGFDNISDEKAKVVYGLIDENIGNVVNNAYRLPGELTLKQIAEAVDAYLNDHPEVFWLKYDFSYVYENGYTNIFFKLSMDSSERVEGQKKLDAVVDKIIAEAPENASALELEIYINDYLVDNCEYDDEAAKSKGILGNANDAYGALVEKKAVCEGYTRAFSLLCNEFGIENTCVSGVGADPDGRQEPHIWNCVKLGESWYHLDVTWNDSNSENDNITRYIYLNLDDETMYQNHTHGKLYSEISDEEFEKNAEYRCNSFVPKCDAMDYNYYQLKGVELDSFDDCDDLVDSLADVAKRKDDCFYILIDEDINYDDALNQIVDGYMMDWVEKANLQNFYNPTIEDSLYIYDVKLLNLVIVEMKYK